MLTTLRTEPRGATDRREHTSEPSENVKDRSPGGLESCEEPEKLHRNRASAFAWRAFTPVPHLTFRRLLQETFSCHGFPISFQRVFLEAEVPNAFCPTSYIFRVNSQQTLLSPFVSSHAPGATVAAPARGPTAPPLAPRAPREQLRGFRAWS